MTKSIGITKLLNDDEDLVYTSSQTQLLFLKQEVYTKIVGWEKTERVTSMCRAIVYVTNQRLILLKLFEVPGVSTGQKKNVLAAAAGTFVEIPLSSISHVIKRSLTLSKENTFRFVTVFGEDQLSVDKGLALEIGFNEKSVSIKKDTTSVAELLLILGEPLFTLPSVLTEQIKLRVSAK